jgi:hypothetical protein
MTLHERKRTHLRIFVPLKYLHITVYQPIVFGGTNLANFGAK